MILSLLYSNETALTTEHHVTIIVSLPRTHTQLAIAQTNDNDDDFGWNIPDDDDNGSTTGFVILHSMICKVFTSILLCCASAGDYMMPLENSGWNDKISRFSYSYDFHLPKRHSPNTAFFEK